jgi:hypothetical protein
MCIPCLRRSEADAPLVMSVQRGKVLIESRQGVSQVMSERKFYSAAVEQG